MKGIAVVCGVICLSLGAIAEEAEVLQLARRGFHQEELRGALARLTEKVDSLRDSDSRTALHLAAQGSQFEGTMLLIQAGADANATDSTGQTPLFSAVKMKSEWGYSVVELLTYAGADVNHVAADGSTPLSIAARVGNTDAVKFLLRRGAIVAPSTPESKSEATEAIKAGKREIVALRSTAGPAEEEAPPSDPKVRDAKFDDAVRSADLAAVVSLVNAGADVNAKDSSGGTPLFRAVAARRPELVFELLFLGADPDLARNDGKTPLMEAMRFLDHGGTRMTLLLLSAGANVNAATPHGTTALSEAVTNRNNFGAKWMIWSGAKLEVKTPKGTLMQLAKRRKDWPSMVTLLKKNGVPDDPALPEPPETKLFDAIRAKNRDGALEQLQAGVSAKVTDEEGCPPLSWAAHYGAFDIVDALLQYGADVNQPNAKSSLTTLHELARWGRSGGDGKVAAEHMEKLIERGADPNLTTRDGKTALMIAAEHGTSGPNLDLLLRVTKDLNARSKAGKTALQMARERGFAEVVEKLEARGATE